MSLKEELGELVTNAMEGWQCSVPVENVEISINNNKINCDAEGEMDTCGDLMITLDLDEDDVLTDISTYTLIDHLESRGYTVTKDD